MNGAGWVCRGLRQLSKRVQSLSNQSLGVVLLRLEVS